MNTKKRQKARKRFAIIIVVIIIVALVFTYVFSLRAYAVSNAPETPPPPEYGTDWDYDESTLPPWPEEEEEELPPVLLIYSTNVLLDVGQTVAIQFKAENFPDGALLTWTSDNPSIAGVDQYGYVIAYAPGKTQISVSGEGLKSSVLVTVNDLKAKKISIKVEEGVAQLGHKSYEVAVGDVIHLSSYIEPQGAKVDKIVWQLGNDRVATINPNSQTCEFIAKDVGETQVTVTANGLVDAVSFQIIESGVPVDTIWVYIRYGIIIVVVIVAIAVFLTWLSQKRKKEKARQKAAAKKRREEAIRRAREEDERRMREEAADQEIRGPKPAQTEERVTLKINGSAVGASVSAPRNGGEEAHDIPVTLDDLD